MTPQKRQILFATAAAFAIFSFGILRSASEYLPAFESAFKAGSLSAIGYEAFERRAVLMPLIGFFAATITIHLLVFNAPVLAQRSLLYRKKNARDSLALTGFLTLLLVIGLLYLNESLFPRSSANVLSLRNSSAFSSLIGLSSLVAITVAVTAGAALALWRFAGQNPKLSVGASVACIIFALGMSGTSEPAARPTVSQPNVLLIGIDSLRPDHVGAARTANVTAPALSTFMDRSTVFSDASTVIGRSYPAWYSVFSGEYPHVSGVRYNLQSRDLLGDQPLLPQILRQHGYTTIYATDETRFSNIDETFGFDHVIAPAQGLEDFLVISFADIPLVNIFSNAPFFGRVLSIVGLNRQSQAYMPSTFSRHLHHRTQSIISNTEKPVFLVVDFAVAHYPYHSHAWNPQRIFDFRAPTAVSLSTPEKYANAVRAADTQFGRLMQELEANGLLKNSVSIVFSDHGENLGEGALGYTTHTDAAISFGLIGHGISILDDWTHHVVLAVHDTRDSSSKGAIITRPVELIDIAPTLLSILSIASPEMTFSGHDLTGEPKPARYRLRESGIRFPTLMGPEIDEVAVATQAMQNYLVTEDGRLEIRPELHETILTNKQRGLEMGGVMLTYIEAENELDPRHWIIVDRNSGDIFNFSDYPNQHVARHLFEAFCRIYRNDPYFEPEAGDCLISEN